MEGPCMISTLISEQLGINCCVLMGANIANEIAVEKFSEATVGYREDKEIAQRWVQLFNTPYFQVSAVQDVEGVELCGYTEKCSCHCSSTLLVNCVLGHIASAVVPNMGNNTKAAIMRIGLVEIKAFSKLLFSSVKDSTFFESCGVADLITTCLGGRNRRVAEAFAKKNGKRSFDELEAEMLQGQKLQNNTLVLHQHSRILAVLCRNVEDVMLEVSKKEKQAGIVPDLDIDTYMKAISAAGLETSLQTDYILKILGLGVCAETIVGNAMRRGISGGQKKRVTTGEMIAGPTKVLLMDEISTGLDSTTTFQIMSYLQQLAHIAECTMLVSLLQPAPEVFDLFDDMVLMAEGKVIYHGPYTNVLKFFENCGFKCPERKGITEFLQEVTSRKDQAQYWNYIDLPYSYISVDEFRTKFSESSLGQNLDQELFQPANKTAHGLSFSKYSVKKRDLFQACMAREWLLMKRNSFVYIVKCAQIGVIALITMTVFLRTNMELNMVRAYYILGSLFYALIRVITTGVAELGFSIRTFLCL